MGYALQTDALRDNYWNSDIISVGIGNSARWGSAPCPAPRGVSAAQLQASDGYSGIFADWRVDVDNADGDGDPATGPDEVWDFGTAEELPRPEGGLRWGRHGHLAGIWQPAKRSGVNRPAVALRSVGPCLSPDLVPKLEVPNGKYDTDGDGLIEISNLEQLDAIRHDLDGNGVANELTTGAPTAEFLSRLFGNREPTVGKWANAAAHAQAFPAGPGESVCLRSCRGFELTRSLDFNDPSSYAAGQVNASWTQGQRLDLPGNWGKVAEPRQRRSQVRACLRGQWTHDKQPALRSCRDLSRQEAPMAGLFGMVTIGVPHTKPGPGGCQSHQPRHRRGDRQPGGRKSGRNQRQLRHRQPARRREGSMGDLLAEIFGRAR